MKHAHKRDSSKTNQAFFIVNTATLISNIFTDVFEQCVQQNLIYSTLNRTLLFLLLLVRRLTREGLGLYWDRHMQLGDY